MISKRSIETTVFAAFLFAATPLFAQSYCPIAFIGQFGNSWYYDCQVCDPGPGQGNNCAPQNVWFSGKQTTGDGCQSCGGSCMGVMSSRAGGIAPTIDEACGLDLNADANLAYSDSDDFIVNASDTKNTFIKTQFVVTIVDSAMATHYFKCFLIRNQTTGRWLCVGRELMNGGGATVAPVNVNLLAKQLDKNHYRARVVPDPSKRDHQPYCYLTTVVPASGQAWVPFAK